MDLYLSSLQPLHVPLSLQCAHSFFFFFFQFVYCLADSLGHNKQDRLCCERLQEDECLGRDLGECCLPGLQLLAQVRRMGWVPSSSPKTLHWQVA